MDPLIEVLARTTDETLCDAVYVCLIEHLGYDSLAASDAHHSRDVVAIFDVYAWCGAIFNDGLPRFLDDREPQARIAESYEFIGASHQSRLLKYATRRAAQRKLDGLPELTRADEDQELDSIEDAFYRYEKLIQDRLAAFIRSRLRDPLFFGTEIRDALVGHLNRDTP